MVRGSGLSLCKTIPALPPVLCFSSSYIYRFYTGTAAAQSPAIFYFMIHFRFGAVAEIDLVVGATAEEGDDCYDKKL
jgi:hypothetical protein